MLVLKMCGKRVYFGGPTWRADISLKEFLNLQPSHSRVSHDTLQKYYDNYRKEWEKDQIKIFFNDHENEQWFIEKYDPIVSYGIYKNTLEDISRISKKFCESVKNGDFDDLTLEASSEILDMQKEQLKTNIESEKLENNENSNAENPLKDKTEIILEEKFKVTGAPYFGFDPNG